MLVDNNIFTSSYVLTLEWIVHLYTHTTSLS